MDNIYIMVLALKSLNLTSIFDIRQNKLDAKRTDYQTNPESLSQTKEPYKTVNISSIATEELFMIADILT